MLMGFHHGTWWRAQVVAGQGGVHRGARGLTADCSWGYTAASLILLLLSGGGPPLLPGPSRVAGRGHPLCPGDCSSSLVRVRCRDWRPARACGGEGSQVCRGGLLVSLLPCPDSQGRFIAAPVGPLGLAGGFTSVPGGHSGGSAAALGVQQGSHRGVQRCAQKTRLGLRGMGPPASPVPWWALKLGVHRCKWGPTGARMGGSTSTPGCPQGLEGGCPPDHPEPCRGSQGRFTALPRCLQGLQEGGPPLFLVAHWGLQVRVHCSNRGPIGARRRGIHCHAQELTGGAHHCAPGPSATQREVSTAVPWVPLGLTGGDPSLCQGPAGV